MALDNEQTQILTGIGSQLLMALGDVAKLARAKLSGVRSSAPANALAVGMNPMVGGPSPERNLAAIHSQDRENLRRLEREPFVARIVVRWEDEEPPRDETIYISRASAAGIARELPGVKLATYAAALGRLAEFSASEDTTVIVGGREREAYIVERIQLSPRTRNGEWDAVDDLFEFLRWNVGIESVRQFIEQLARSAQKPEEDIPDVLGDLLNSVEEAALVRDVVRRKVIERMTLRDQPILDRYQGEIFRMPLDQRLILLGPPGTGKTTTLIRRLAQKRTQEALTTGETEALTTAGLHDLYLYSNSWAMFSPTELLKLYLRDAFNREGVPASDSNLKTWDKERLHLGRNVLGILRSAESGRFQLDETTNILFGTSSEAGRQLYEEFTPYFETEVLDRLTNAFNQLQFSEDEELKKQVRTVVGLRRRDAHFSTREIAHLLQEAAQLQPHIKRLDDWIRQELHSLSNRLVYTHRNLLDEMVEVLPSIIGVETREEEEDEDEETEEAPLSQPVDSRSIAEKRAVAAEILLTSLRGLARSYALGRSTPAGRAGRVIKILGDRLPPREALSQVGTAVVMRAHVRSLMQAPRLFVMGAPRIYNRFRRQLIKEGRLFNPDLGDAIRQMRISPCEVDVLILTMLRNARRLLEESPSQLAGSNTPDWLENIKSQYLMQVFVDEATDFSAIQLACTMELSHPRLRSWFACGDLNQRITSHGMRDLTEIEWLRHTGGGSIETREVDIAYRQSRRLRELAMELSTQDGAGDIKLRAPEHGEDADVWPLLAENHTGDLLATWLAGRITEVERAVGKLPSIAVFVDGEAMIDPLVERVHTLLAERNIPVVGCKDGRVVGDDLEVRVFDVRHIKGLEFEAVFFIGIDRLAERLPDLFDRFFYVGASRAATYLGVTCDGRLPAALEPVRGHFSTGNWQV